jgi:ligand-binding sensor domain-containing protein/signal transduction histidine kinase
MDCGFLRRGLFGIGMALIASMSLVNEVCALEPATPLSQMSRQAWTMENGLPQNTVPVLWQSQSGFLWAGTELGLARFDGVSFRVFDHAANSAFPDAEIRCLLDSGKDGSLWVGTSDGMVRWVHDSATLISTQSGLPSNSILGLAQTTDGTIWVWTEGGLARWDGKQFQAITGTHHPSGTEITSIAPDSRNGLWVGTKGDAVVFREGHWSDAPSPLAEVDSSRTVLDHGSLVKAVEGGEVLIASANGVYLQTQGELELVAGRSALPSGGVSFLDRLPDGTIAIGSKSVVVLVPGSGSARGLSRFVVSKELPGSRIESILGDREGSLWVGTNRGLARIEMNAGVGEVQQMPSTDPLASNSIVSLLEDREGDLWVGTEAAGLHILRDARFRILGTSDGLSSDATTAIVQDTQQTLWIGTRDSGLNRIAKSAEGKLLVVTLTTSTGLLSDVILSLAVAPNGDLWVGTPDGLNQIPKGGASKSGVKSYTSADGLADDFIRSVLVTPDNSVWVGTRRGLTHLDHGRFESFTHADGLGSDLVGALARTADGDLWIATLNGLSRLHQGKLKNYTTADGLSSNVITALEAMPDGRMWIGTQSDSLNLWDGTKFTAIHGKSATAGAAALLPSVIHTLMRDDRGHLWLASDKGLTRVDLADLEDCAQRLQNGSCGLSAAHVVNFTTADGLRSRETSSNSHPTACRASNGTLWFTTPRGIIVVDPLHFPATQPAPPIVIERFAVDDHDLQGDVGGRIRAGALRFEFDYAGLSFATPQKLRYQYMLEGFDHAWTDAGTRRTAYYTNIPAGPYRFRVRASLGDGTSNPAEEASYSFELMPHYYQTVWFRALVVMVVVGLVVLVFRRRVLRVEREFRAVMGERNRIAREIHDTLAQGYVGISLQLEVLGELLRHRRTDAAMQHLTNTQGLVREGLDDARQSIWALRSHDAGEKTLPIRLRRLVEKAKDGQIESSLEVHGAYRALSVEAEQEILRIAQEAIHNVKKHANASQMTVRLDYDERALAMTVSDDGQGFALESGDAQKIVMGHYGLTGMRERTALIRGEIEIQSKPGLGTTVRVYVPAPEAGKAEFHAQVSDKEIEKE